MHKLFQNILLPICIVFSYCNSRVSTLKINRVLSDSSVSTVDNDLFESFPAFTKNVGLPSIQDGADFLEYRLWMNVSADIINLIRIHYTNERWQVSETIIWSHIPEYEWKRNDTVNHLLATIVDSTRTRQLVPDISLDRFIDSLQYFNLQEAPPNLEIQKSISLPTDSWRYTFEIADKDQYRIIEYNCGEVHSLIDFHRKVERLLQFLKQHLKVEFRNCIL